MKNKFIIPIILLVLAINLPSLCDENQFFGSLGLIPLVYECNKTSPDDYKVNWNFGDGLFLNAKFGYSIADIFSFGVETELIIDPEYDMIDTDTNGFSIKYKNNSNPLKSSIESAVKKDIFTLMTFFKISLSGKYKPYIIACIGLLNHHSYIESTITYFSSNMKNGYYFTSKSDSQNDNALSAKGGIGFEFKPDERFSLWIEGCYVSGFGDLDYIRYFTTTLGFSIYF